MEPGGLRQTRAEGIGKGAERWSPKGVKSIARGGSPGLDNVAGCSAPRGRNRL